MLYIDYSWKKDTCTWIEDEFRKQYIINKHSLDDALIDEMCLDVDKTEHVQGDLFRSPIWGPCSVDRLSEGLKGLILVYWTGIRIDATLLGSNCAKWLVEISKIKDITIELHYLMEFPEKFEAVSVISGKQIHYFKDYLYDYIALEIDGDGYERWKE